MDDEDNAVAHGLVVLYSIVAWAATLVLLWRA
jgi:hypothetical protein